MSTQPVPTLVPQPEPAPPAPKEIPELTEAYRKAHKSYVLTSGLLASWELIGITLQTKEKWGIELKSPAAVPLILFTLVIYSGYKMTIEWMQCNPERQKHPAAKWDYRIAHSIAITAIAISAVQYLLHIQLVDILANHSNALSYLGNGLFVLAAISLHGTLAAPITRTTKIMRTVFLSLILILSLALNLLTFDLIPVILLPLFIIAELIVIYRRRQMSKP